MVSSPTYGVLDTESVDSSAIAAVGDRSQAVNAGLIRVGGDNNAAVFVLGEDAVAMNRGLILIEAPPVRSASRA